VAPASALQILSGQESDAHVRLRAPAVRTAVELAEVLMRNRILAIGVFSALLLSLVVSRLSGQGHSGPNLVVMCGDCPGSLFKVTAEQGMLLMQAGGENDGQLWFYSFTPGTAPLQVGRLPAVGRPIVWQKRP
jgi:hypothetical protein